MQVVLFSVLLIGCEDFAGESKCVVCVCGVVG
jgi:hypothetical protein